MITVLDEVFPFCTSNMFIFTSSLQEIPMDVHESKTLTIQFDPAYQDDAHSRVAEKIITIKYQEHPHVVSLKELFFYVLWSHNVQAIPDLVSRFYLS